MQTGHAYARALRAHILSAAAITSLLLENPGCLTGVNIQNLGATKAALFDGELASNCLHNQESVPQVMQVIDDLMLSNAAGSRTGKLWVNYLIQVYYLKLFLFAERTCDWEIHLYCICKMIPMFHAAGHFAYAKAAQLYLQQMKSLQNIMTLPAYEKFAEKAYFATRRSNNFWSGNFSDQTIEQELMNCWNHLGAWHMEEVLLTVHLWNGFMLYHTTSQHVILWRNIQEFILTHQNNTKIFVSVVQIVILMIALYSQNGSDLIHHLGTRNTMPSSLYPVELCLTTQSIVIRHLMLVRPLPHHWLERYFQTSSRVAMIVWFP